MNNFFSDTQHPLPFTFKGPIYQYFQQQARLHPYAAALISQNEYCTYLELEEISSRLASRLREHGIGCGDIVAVYSKRNPAVIYAMLGILKSGGAFFIADAEYPAKRTLDCCTMARPSILLVCGEFALSDDLLTELSDKNKTQVWRIPSKKQDALQALAPYPSLNPLPDIEAHDIAYISFTSGSTGKPKGIITSQAPLPHFIEWHIQQHGFNDKDRFSFLSGLGHDPALRDIFTPLSVGASLHIPDPSIVFNPFELFNWLEAQKITVLHLTPALGEIICSSEKNGRFLHTLRGLFWGGDTLSPKLSQKMRRVAPNAIQVNFYGTTETPQAMSYYTIPPSTPHTHYPIGKGISDVQLIVVNPSGKLAAAEEAGEILIRTPYLSQGYLNDPELTQQKYITPPFSQIPGDRCYKTGDLGKYLNDGNVAFLGRQDHQVKIRGFRVELDEVLLKIEALPGIKRALVLAKDVGRESKVLVAYYTCEEGQNVINSELRQALAQVLPSYMVPAFIVNLDKFELLPNGKINLQALPLPAASTSEESETSLTDRELELVKIWRSILGVDQVNVNDSFIELGGDSLSAIQALIAMQRLGIPEALAIGVLRGKTIAQIVQEEQGLASNLSQSPEILSETTKSGLLVNVLRGILILIVVSDHWFPGLLNHLPKSWGSLQYFLNPVFNISTPGFAFVFGINLGYNFFPEYLSNPHRIKNKLVFGLWLLGISILISSSLKLIIVMVQGKTVTSTDIFVMPFGPFLYYLLALLSVPAWFKLISRFSSKISACLGLMAAFYIVHLLCLELFLNREQTGFLQLIRLMLVAKYAYFNMSVGVLGGVALGIFLSGKTKDHKLAGHLFLGGALLALSGITLLFLDQGNLHILFSKGDDMGLWRWLTYTGIVILLASFFKALINRFEQLPPTLQLSIKFGSVIGLCTLPMYVLHDLVLQFKTLLYTFGVPELLSIMLPLFLSILICFWMMKKIYRLYYAT